MASLLGCGRARRTRLHRRSRHRLRCAVGHDHPALRLDEHVCVAGKSVTELTHPARAAASAGRRARSTDVNGCQFRVTAASSRRARQRTDGAAVLRERRRGPASGDACRPAHPVGGMSPYTPPGSTFPVQRRRRAGSPDDASTREGAMPTETPTVDTVDPRMLLHVLTRLEKGDFAARMPDDLSGIAGKIADTLNAVMETNQRMVRELGRVGRAVGKQGKTSQRLSIGDVSGGWVDSVDAVNGLIDDLVRPTADMARVIGAVANGDLSQTVPLEVDGRALEGQFKRTAKTVNTMVHQLGSFASEVTRVAREVGSEGKLGGQATVRGVGGVWKDLTDNVNMMAGNLTSQVRNIAEVTTAVANGDLSKKITVDVRGEILELKNTINTMVDQLDRKGDE